MNFKIMIPLVCLLFFDRCSPHGAVGLVAQLGDTISDGNDSYKVTEVTWSTDFLIFTTDLVFDDVTLADYFFSGVTIADGTIDPPIDNYTLFCNREKTNLENETQIGEDFHLTVTGSYSFYFDQELDKTSLFRENEYSYIVLYFPIVQSGYTNTYFKIFSSNVNFDIE